MAGNKLVLNTAEFIADLRKLPQELKGDATGIVMDAALQTQNTVRAVYESHRVSGNLANGLTVNVEQIGPFGAAAVVRSRAPHAWLFDHGSAARHYITGSGATHETGKMWGKTAPTHIFIRTAIRKRREMYEKLRALMESKGLTVTGSVE